MKFLVIGLGSMGKRRIRCLLSLGYGPESVAGFDVRGDRRQESENEYGISVYEEIEGAVEHHHPDAFIISVPPDLHHIFMKKAIDYGVSFFVEASVLDTDTDKIIHKVETNSIKGIPSATLMFHPAIKLIKEQLEVGSLGNISSITFHSGQYLPDWHTYESVDDFYVSNKLTGGAREITPFELTWITQLFGFPKRVSGIYRKTIEIGGAEEIDDTYSFLLDYGSFVCNALVDVVSRAATRSLLINGDRKQLRWDWDKDAIEVFDPEKGEWQQQPYTMTNAQAGYDHHIGENMYIDEIQCFIDAIKEKTEFPNTLQRDLKVLQLLYAIEEASDSNSFVNLE